MMAIVEQLVEWRLAGETEVFGENLPQGHFVDHKSHMTWPVLETGPPRWKPVTNLLSYGTDFRGMDLITTPLSQHWNSHKRGPEYEETVVHCPQNSQGQSVMHGYHSLRLIWKKWHLLQMTRLWMETQLWVNATTEFKENNHVIKPLHLVWKKRLT
jgi:hypothetical protein